mmetsp:Transcript_26823/g.52010  ORF Transcript_26823/g.52010 Transcript_26823/m.52010 type:complete len:212 (+) Transcript_26823:19-654(+)
MQVVQSFAHHLDNAFICDAVPWVTHILDMIATKTTPCLPRSPQLLSVLFASITAAHLIGVLPILSRYWLVLEKCLHPKKPRFADKPEGCAAVRTRCFVRSRFTPRCCAFLPHSRKTRPLCRSFSASTNADVSCSQPLLRWLLASFARTVRAAFRRSTPCSAQGVRLPHLGWNAGEEDAFSSLRSEATSLKMFLREEGKGTPFFTEKLSPSA